MNKIHAVGLKLSIFTKICRLQTTCTSYWLPRRAVDGGKNLQSGVLINLACAVTFFILPSIVYEQ